MAAASSELNPSILHVTMQDACESYSSTRGRTKYHHVMKKASVHTRTFSIMRTSEVRHEQNENIRNLVQSVNHACLLCTVILMRAHKSHNLTNMIPVVLATLMKDMIYSFVFHHRWHIIDGFNVKGSITILRDVTNDMVYGPLVTKKQYHK